MHDGVVAGTAAEGEGGHGRSRSRRVGRSTPAAGPAGLEIVFRPDPTIWDGRFANNGWLQELPKPLTKLTWDNAALHRPDDGRAARAVKTEQVVELRLPAAGRSARRSGSPGPGRRRGDASTSATAGPAPGGSATGSGFNAYALRTSDAPWRRPGPRTSRRRARPTTWPPRSITTTWKGATSSGSATLADFLKDPDFAQEHEDDPHERRARSLYPEPSATSGHEWGMAINLNTCIGCNACVIACQAENNIPVVGKDQVARGREMHWIRDRPLLTTGPDDDPETSIISPCPACTARTPRASWSARSRRRCTTPRG